MNRKAKVGLDTEPYASLIGPSSGDSDDPGFLPTFASSAIWSGLDEDDPRALGLVAVYAGGLEVWLWRLLREFAGGRTAATQVLTRDLPLNRVTAYLRELGDTPGWLEFSERFLLSDLLADVDDAMKTRNLIVHGGVNGSVLDQNLVGYTARRRRLSRSSGMDSEVFGRDDLRRLATRLFELSTISMYLWTEATTHTDHTEQ